MLMRDGGVCEDCVGRRFGLPAIVHRCYRDDRLASFSVVSTVALHQVLGTWKNRVARYIALCEFARSKVLEAGLRPERVVVKPNFARDRHVGVDLDQPRSGALYLGRLSVEKGVEVLIDAWRMLEVPLAVIGTGPLEANMRSAQAATVTMHGFLSDEEVTEAMRRASFLVMPSIVYEGFPMVVAESFSAGTPIVASRLGALAELVEDGVTGLHFNPGDPTDLSEKVRWAHAHPAEMAAMGRNARLRYVRSYTPEANYTRLMDIYDEARATVPS
jgi:glycosyltransferase involved in cell wall biosynthesis